MSAGGIYSLMLTDKSKSSALRLRGIECPIVDRVCLRCDKTDMDLSSNALKISAKIIKDRLVKKVRQAKAKQILGKRY